MGFLASTKNVQRINGLLEDVHEALINYQVCVLNLQFHTMPDVYARLHYNKISMMRVVGLLWVLLPYLTTLTDSPMSRNQQTSLSLRKSTVPQMPVTSVETGRGVKRELGRLSSGRLNNGQWVNRISTFSGSMAWLELENQPLPRHLLRGCLQMEGLEPASSAHKALRTEVTFRQYFQPLLPNLPSSIPFFETSYSRS